MVSAAANYIYKGEQFDAVLFDCDGVLVDSEPITNSVLRVMLEESGWTLSPEECFSLFVGKAVKDEVVLIESNTGVPLTEGWLVEFRERRNQALEAQLKVVEGAGAAVEAAQRHSRTRIACASGADRFKVEMQLRKVGLYQAFEGHIFSGHEMKKSKPAPDVYLAAAVHLGVNPERCLVIEDSATGAQAGLAAGATVWGYCPMGHGRAFEHLAVGQVFHHMADLKTLLGE